MASLLRLLILSTGVLFITLSPSTASAQDAKLAASDGARSDLFGQTALDLSDGGDYAIVGAWQHDHPTFLSGSAYVFARTGDTWGEQAELTAFDAAAGDQFGEAVALSGDGQYAIVGAPGNDDTFFLSGNAYVFARSGSTWSLQDTFYASDPGDNDRFGKAVALSADGTVALIGAWLDGGPGTSTGSAYVFTRSGSTWTEEAKLTANDGADGDWFGSAVALSADGQHALIGAQSDDAGAGSAYVFNRSGTTWSQQAKLTASDAAGGDLFGRSVGISADGQHAVIGAYLDDAGGTEDGSAYVFVRSGSTWSEQAKLTANDAANNDQFGYSVAISGDGTMVLVGANAEDEGGSDAGAAYVFRHIGSAWSEINKLIASDAAQDDFFGRTVSLSADGTYALVGADGDDDNGDDSGSAYVFGASVLPVELTTFTAVADGADVVLQWRTASESGNAGFAVEQHDPPSPGATWREIAFVTGAGTTTAAQSYRHTVADLAPGTHRFRLKQIDVDGTFAYSPAVEVTAGLADAFALTPPAPNPFSTQAQLALSVQQTQHVRITVHDVLGRRVTQLYDGTLTAGTAHRFALDGGGWAAGLYLLRVEGEQFRETFRTVLVK